MPLQNHVGDHEFPVRPRRRWSQLADAQRRTDQKAMSRRAIMLVAISVTVAVPVGLLGWIVWPDGTELRNPFIVFCGGLVLGLILGVIVFTILDNRGPLRAQREYLELARHPELTLRQQQVLALDAVSDYSFGGWNASLAFIPTFAELPQSMRDRHGNGAKSQPWPFLPMNTLAQLRASLDEQHKVASGLDIHVLAADFQQRGPNSKDFAAVAEGDRADYMFSRVAATSQTPEFDLRDLALAHGPDAQPTLLLASDVERTIGAVRYAYVAGYITAAEAWELLDPVADRAFRQYDSWDAYWRDVIVGTAFRTDSLDAVQRQRETLEKFRASDWPAARVPWPTEHAAARS